MALIDEFKALVASNDTLSLFIDTIEERDYGVKYTFDGIMQCALAYRDGVYIDIGDTNDDRVLNDIKRRKNLSSCRFKSLEAWAKFVIGDLSMCA